jgi:hypothetical protein
MTQQSLEMVWPGGGSVAVFVAIVLGVCVALTLATYRAFTPERASPEDARVARRRAGQVALALVAVMLGSALLAEGGALARLAGTPAFLAYPGVITVAVVLLAASRFGRRLGTLPLAWLVLFQAFRLPLELVLHAWYAAGSVPVQMTFAGQNLDIVTGVAALVVGAVAWSRPTRVRPLLWGFNVVGIALLLNVMRVAITSSPVPLRTFTDGPPLLLPFHAPFTWIVPLCVAPALLGHLVLFRALRGGGARAAHGARPSASSPATVGTADERRAYLRS